MTHSHLFPEGGLKSSHYICCKVDVNVLARHPGTCLRRSWRSAIWSPRLGPALGLPARALCARAPSATGAPLTRIASSALSAALHCPYNSRAQSFADCAGLLHMVRAIAFGRECGTAVFTLMRPRLLSCAFQGHAFPEILAGTVLACRNVWIMY